MVYHGQNHHESVGFQYSVMKSKAIVTKGWGRVSRGWRRLQSLWCDALIQAHIEQEATNACVVGCIQGPQKKQDDTSGF